MNFTREIKREIMKSAPEERSLGCAFLAALLETSGKTDANGFSFTSESEEVAAYLVRLAEKTFGITMSVTEAVRDPKHGRDKLTFSYSGENAAALTRELSAHGLNGEMEEDCAQSYLRGAFLGGGSCTLPGAGTKTGYHLEIVFERETAADIFIGLLYRFQVIGNVIMRNERYVVYLKSREAISDFLSVIGAEGALGTLETVSRAREARGNVNRKSNCFASNMDKSAIASAQQALALGKLKEEGRFAILPEPLIKTAQARLENPALSLSELADRLGVSKSCLNHRLRKLMEIYKKETRE